jgi:hypothetical protein
MVCDLAGNNANHPAEFVPRYLQFAWLDDSSVSRTAAIATVMAALLQSKFAGTFAACIDRDVGERYDSASQGSWMSHRRRLLVAICPYCGSFDVRRSHRRGLREVLFLPLALLRPFRCEDCDRRHYNMIFCETLPSSERPNRESE